MDYHQTFQRVIITLIAAIYSQTCLVRAQYGSTQQSKHFFLLDNYSTVTTITTVITVTTANSVSTVTTGTTFTSGTYITYVCLLEGVCVCV